MQEPTKIGFLRSILAFDPTDYPLLGKLSSFRGFARIAAVVLVNQVAHDIVSADQFSLLSQIAPDTPVRSA
jgi:hypothetical protein